MQQYHSNIAALASIQGHYLRVTWRWSTKLMFSSWREKPPRPICLAHSISSGFTTRTHPEILQNIPSRLHQIFVTKLPLVICRTSGSVEPPDIYYSSAGSAPQQDHHDRFPKAVLAERSEYSVCFSILESHLSSLLCPLLPPSPHGFQCCLSLLYLLPCFSLHRAG